MIYDDGKECKLISRHFVVNIALPAMDENGLLRINRDPRKQRIKPSCYPGVVEEVADSCQYVKVGDRVVFERWEWQQRNLDDERVLVRERELIAINGQPALNVMILELFEKKLPIGITVPDTYRPAKPIFYHAKVLATNAHEEFGLVGEEIYLEAHTEGQFIGTDGRMFLQLGRGANILMRLSREEAQSKVLLEVI